MTGREATCSGDDACKVPSHWQDEAYSGPHRDPAALAAMDAGREATCDCGHPDTAHDPEWGCADCSCADGRDG